MLVIGVAKGGEGTRSAKKLLPRIPQKGLLAAYCCVRLTMRCLGYSVLDAGLSCTKGVWYIYDCDTGSSLLIR